MYTVARATIKGISAYGQSRFHNTPKLPKELSQDYEDRTWHERAHYTKDAKQNVLIPGAAFKLCVEDAAKFLSVQVPGKGKATWTKNFVAGVLVIEDLILSVTHNDITTKPEHKTTLHVPADGRKGGEKRVIKHFPTLLSEQWGGEVEFNVFDNSITEDVFLYHLKQAGQLIGLGFFRPRRGGNWGRFNVVDMTWTQVGE